MKWLLTLFLLVFLIPSSHATPPRTTTLNGVWSIALDPVSIGIKQQWYRPDFEVKYWDKVTVPHSFTVDPRYHKFTGDVWYTRKFPNASIPKGYRAFLHFEAVFYKATVWLNGKEVGNHEGGYTPFEFDVTEALSGQNTLTIKVNNAWDTTTIPGAKTQVDFEGSSSSQVFPWMNYGGITRDVQLVIRPELYIENLKVVALPNLSRKSGTMDLAIRVKNLASIAAVPENLQVSLTHEGKKTSLKQKSARQTIAAGQTESFKLNYQIPNVDLWHFDDPNLYHLEVILGKDTARQQIGFRSIEVRGTQLLLNGEPVRMGGCNRPLDYPEFGSLEPLDVIEKDMNLIKKGSMELSRISHYPVTRDLLDWADQHGMLLILEASNWQLTPKQMADPVIREKFKAQFKEMAERDWNHPSVIAWSVGNEYQSQSPEGLSWTKDMVAFCRQLDPSRLVTFSSMIVWRDIIQRPEEEASQYVDFISANIYGNHLKHVQHIHSLYPDKPVYISEFGIRADQVSNEEQRIQHLKKAMDDFRNCDYVIGASIWTFNDYQSMFPGTNKDGYRHWGLVSADRRPREMYYTWQEELAPLTLEVKNEAGTTAIVVTARKTIPSYVLRNYELRVNSLNYPLGVLQPGQTKLISFPTTNGELNVEVVKPGGFVILRKTLK